MLRIRKNSFYAIIAFVIHFFSIQIIRADIIRKESIESIVKRSNLILVGKISNIEESIIYKSLSLKRVNCQIKELIKGNYKNDYVFIDGCKEKLFPLENEYGLAKFTKSEEVLLFLVKYDDIYEVAGAYQGRYKIIENRLENYSISLSNFISKIKNYLNGKIDRIDILGYSKEKILDKNSNNEKKIMSTGDFKWENYSNCGMPADLQYCARWHDTKLPVNFKINIGNPGTVKYHNGISEIILSFDQIKNCVNNAINAWSFVEGSYFFANIDNNQSNINNSCDENCIIHWISLPDAAPAFTLNYLKSNDPIDFGYMRSVDILMNARYYWNADFSSYPVLNRNDVYDIQSIVMHEMGHVISLGHTTRLYTSVMTPENAGYNKKLYSPDIGDQKGAAFANPLLNSGFLNGENTWDGDIRYEYPKAQIHITGNITIPSGSSLTIEPGAIVKFYNGSSLNVYGTLNANGTSSNRIIFQSGDGSSWGGIKIYSNNVSMSYCKIQNATTGIYIQSASPSIQWTWINNSTYGISVNGGTSSFTSNTLAYNSSAGLTSYNSATVLMNNYARNVITGSYTGIYSVNSGYISAFNGYNSIYSCSGYLATAGNNGNIMADGNYWGQCPPPSSWFYGNVTYTNSVCPDPNAGRTLQKHNSIMEYNPPIVKNNNQSDDLGEIYKNWQEKDYTSVKTKSKALINLSSEKNIKYQAIIMYRAACQMTNDNEIEQYLLEIEKFNNKVN